MHGTWSLLYYYDYDKAYYELRLKLYNNETS